MSKATWYATINQFAGYRDQKLINASFDNTVLNDVYYDGELCAYFLDDYFDNATLYNSYADHAYTTYITNYAAPASYQLPGFWCFLEGITEAFLRRGIAQRAVVLEAIMGDNGGRYMYVGSPGLNAEGRTPETRHEISREFAYSILGWVQVARTRTLTAPEIAFRDQRVTDSLTIIDDWCGTFTASYFRPFMGGITAHALINDYETAANTVQKEAILTALINLANYAWDSCWVEGSLAFNYTDRDIGNPDDLVPQASLNMLIAAWFAWIYSVTYDTSWKTKAEQIFTGGEPIYNEEGFWVSGAYLGGTNPAGVLGKELDQQIVWGPKYFTYVETAIPDPEIIVPAAPGSNVILFNVFK